MNPLAEMLAQFTAKVKQRKMNWQLKKEKRLANNRKVKNLKAKKKAKRKMATESRRRNR